MSHHDAVPTMKHLIPILAPLAVFLACPYAVAQQHGAPHGEAHRHPAGVEIRISGTLVEPVGYFSAASTAQTGAADDASPRGPARALPPVLEGRDGTLYLLSPVHDAAAAAIEAAVGQLVSVNGTVYPAASGYVILVYAIEWVGEGEED